METNLGALETHLNDLKWRKSLCTSNSSSNWTNTIYYCV